MLKTQGLKLTFPEGERCYLGKGNYQLSYLLKCDPQQELQFDTVRKEGVCIIEFNFFTKYACLHFSYKSSSSIFSSSGDSILTSKNILLTLVIVSILYVIVFTFINYRKNPEDGIIKSLPHRSFWSSFFDNSLYGYEICRNLLNRNKNHNQDNI